MTSHISTDPLSQIPLTNGLHVLSRIIESGALQARTGRAVCKSLRQHASFIDMQHTQDAQTGIFWERAPCQQLHAAVASGVLDASVLYFRAAWEVVQRDLDIVVAAMEDRGLLAPAGYPEAQQDAFDDLIEHSSAAAVRAVRCLLARYPAINPAARDNAAVVACGRHGNAAMMQLLLADARTWPGAGASRAVCEACWHSHVEVVRLLIAAGVNPARNGNEAVMAACSNGHAEVVRLLLADARFDPAANNNHSICTASALGHADVVRLLLADARVNPGAAMNPADTNLSIKKASENGHAEVVLGCCLLMHGLTPRLETTSQYGWRAKTGTRRWCGYCLLMHVDPSAEFSYSIQSASHRGHTTVVQLLLADARADPTSNDNFAIRWASVNGHTDVVRLLHADARANPAAKDNYAITWASSNGRTEVVMLLLADALVDPAAGNNHAIRCACARGHTEVVRLLLAHPRVDPTACNNEAVRSAAEQGHTAVVQLLLADGRATLPA